MIINSQKLLETISHEPYFLVVDSHTMGEPTRIVMKGFPVVHGRTMMEKKEYIAQHLDQYRKTILLEPRGHDNMFGAVLLTPVHSIADVGVVFMDSGGYLNMCGHGSMGVASMLVNEKMVHITEPYTIIHLDTPSGIITTRVKVKKERAVEVSLINVPCFLYKKDIQLDMGSLGVISIDVAFGGSFFALVDADNIALSLQSNNIDNVIKTGMNILREINQQECVYHPDLNIHSVDLVEFYSRPDNPEATLKNAVVFGNSQIDRSPCGTGTSAKVAALFGKGLLHIGEPFIYESIMGTIFKARIIKKTKVGDFEAVIPEITGSAYITGINYLCVDPKDPFKYGFTIAGG